jgi:signal peptidase I
MLRLFKVSEHSLTPEYQEGDFVIIAKIPFLGIAYQPGDVVVFNHPAYGRMIKRVQEVFPENHTLFVTGSHPESLDSRHFGPIQMEDTLGKVIWHIKKPASA